MNEDMRELFNVKEPPKLFTKPSLARYIYIGAAVGAIIALLISLPTLFPHDYHDNDSLEIFMILTSLPMTPLYIIVANAPLGRYGDVYCAIIFILQYSIYGVIIGWVVGAVKKHRQKNLQSKSNVQTFKK